MVGRFSEWLGRMAPLALSLGLAEGAWAAGGAHVIDDAAVEAAGVCHLEAWITRLGPGRGVASASPACTPHAWPQVELGVGLAHLEDEEDATTVGPAIKLNLRPVEHGLGVSLAAAGAWNVRSGRLETAGVTAPLTLQAGERLRFNLNGGWLYARGGDHQHMAFAGAQVEVQVFSTVTVMAEAFGRDRGLPGAQVGLRWTRRQGDLDLDLLVGRRVDGVAHTAVTVGLTVRR